MKFASSFSALLVVLPFIVNVAGLAVPSEDGLIARQNRGQQQKNAAAAQKAAQAKAAQANAAKAAQAKAAQGQAAQAAAAKAAQGNKGAAANNGQAGKGAAAAPPPPAAATASNPQALQASTTVDKSVIQNTDNGQNPPVAGQSAADLSPNNFANLCALGLPKVPLTNGLQVTTGSCNPIPIGNIPSVDRMPSSKFQFPKNLDTIPANQDFDIILATKNIQLGTFTNAQKTYFANPQKLNGQGQIIGHTHIVMEPIDSLTSVALTDPKKFFFFKGINEAQDGQGNVKATVTGGAPAGVYRMCTIVSSATHQPAIVPVAQHGSLDDCVYFTATAGGAAAGGAAGGAAAGGAAAGGAAANAGKGKGKGQAAGKGKAANNGQAAAAGQQAAQPATAAPAPAAPAPAAANAGKGKGKGKAGKGGKGKRARQL
ncbi:hypothetical protein R3P38DRAFT_57447 [Favolaschia claudopus]|uniref:Ribosomal protein s17 n=1 Tax=Favolaschia claudopus TaxID=2862362 RepID=A0AAW0EIH1_9AGAR